MESVVCLILFAQCEIHANGTARIEKLNVSGRGMNDRMAILDTRASGPVSQRLKWMDLVDFPGINGDGTINLQGFDVHVGDDDPPTLRMLLVNNRPFLDPVTGALLDATKLGANATIVSWIRRHTGPDNCSYGLISTCVTRARYATHYCI
jgi:hypothetical protein